MKRRAFLAGAGAAAITATWPGWLERAFAASTCKPRTAEALQRLGEAYRRARGAARPLLVLVVPKAAEDKYRRGRAFGAWLNHGTDAQLAALGLCEVVCATMAELRCLIPSVGTGEPLMILVEPASVPAMVRRLDAPLVDSFPDHDPSTRDERLAAAAQADALIDEQTIVIADLLNDALRFRMAGAELAALAKKARATLVKTRIPGSHWATSAGCGTYVEEMAVNSAVGCGMGHVPEKSRRFLYFYAHGPYELTEEDRSED